MLCQCATLLASCENAILLLHYQMFIDETWERFRETITQPDSPIMPLS